uniref:Uncharacterized protein n=1 Tax=Mus spicilegus TaxID=10103 RepID=A0A8C6MVL5_MUSSI
MWSWGGRREFYTLIFRQSEEAVTHCPDFDISDLKAFPQWHTSSNGTPNSSKAIPPSNATLFPSAQLHQAYSPHPGGMLFFTEPRGAGIPYDQKFLLKHLNSPMGQTLVFHLPVLVSPVLAPELSTEVNNLRVWLMSKKHELPSSVFFLEIGSEQKV